MREIKLKNGRVCQNALGIPETAVGLEALLQIAHNRMNIVKHSFEHDRELGCRIKSEWPVSGREALNLAREALLSCPELEAVNVELHGDSVTVLISTPLGEGCITVCLEDV